MGWPYQQKPPMGWPLDYNSGLVPDAGFWWMNEGSGNKVFDLSGNGCNCVLSGDPQWIPGKFGPALDFDGNDYGTVTHKSSLVLPNQLSVSFWIKTTSVARNTILDHFYRDWEFAIDDPDLLVWYGDNVSYADVVFSGGFTADGLWHHIVITVDKAAGIIKAWKDGIYIGTETDSLLSGSSTQDLYIASRGAGSSQVFPGSLDNIHIYNRLLTSSEIALLYQYPFWMFKDPAEIALLGGYQAVVGMSGAMTTNTGYWGW